MNVRKSVRWFALLILSFSLGARALPAQELPDAAQLHVDATQ